MEILQFIFSSFWVWAGTIIISATVIMSTGWMINAIVLGFKGKKCDRVTVVNFS